MKQDNKQQSQRSQSEIESIIRGGQYGSQSEANQYLQQHGLSCQLNEDGTSADIFEGSDNSRRIANVSFTDRDNQRSVTGITYNQTS